VNIRKVTRDPRLWADPANSTVPAAGPTGAAGRRRGYRRGRRHRGRAPPQPRQRVELYVRGRRRPMDRASRRNPGQVGFPDRATAAAGSSRTGRRRRAPRVRRAVAHARHRAGPQRPTAHKRRPAGRRGTRSRYETDRRLSAVNRPPNAAHACDGTEAVFAHPLQTSACRPIAELPYFPPSQRSIGGDRPGWAGELSPTPVRRATRQPACAKSVDDAPAFLDDGLYLPILEWVKNCRSPISSSPRAAQGRRRAR
jgi:hypothetical protein